MTSFIDRILGDSAAFTQIAMAALGDRLGLWKDLAANGPATSTQLARRMGLSERHVREWLAAMAAASYLAYDTTTAQFALGSEHAAVLADEGGPMFLGGIPDLLVSYMKPYDRLVETFRTGGGVPQSAYPEATYRGQERFSAGWYEHLLVQKWLPAAGLDGALASGLRLCDVGCGGGRAIVRLAKAYPASQFVGYDVYGPNVHRARELAERAGVAQRVQFHQLDAAAGIGQSFDVITTFDVVHDTAHPGQLLESIRGGLAARGTYLCLEIKCAARLEDNFGPVGAMLHGVSVLYCMSTSLAHGGAALGTCGLHEGRLRELASMAGFRNVDKLAIDDAFNDLYALTA
ncbi:MAG TPA: class I SAM-dependent methyltransferase [Kofleriaceae bacterium]|nr:class I SAM-dependent methyltransferase [Kofleriaceae bacterium]